MSSSPSAAHSYLYKWSAVLRRSHMGIARHRGRRPDQPTFAIHTVRAHVEEGRTPTSPDYRRQGVCTPFIRVQCTTGPGLKAHWCRAELRLRNVHVKVFGVNAGTQLQVEIRTINLCSKYMPVIDRFFYCSSSQYVSVCVSEAPVSYGSPVAVSPACSIRNHRQARLRSRAVAGVPAPAALVSDEGLR